MIVKILDYIKHLNNSSKLIGSVIIVVFVISLLIFQTISIKELNSAIRREEDLLKKDRERLSHIQNIKKNYSKNQQKLYTLEAQIPPSAFEESILASLQETAESSLTDFTKISFGKTASGDGLTQISLSVSFSGNFYNLLELLNNVKSGSRVVKFDAINISKEKGKNSLKADILATTFHTSGSNSITSSPPVKK